MTVRFTFGRAQRLRLGKEFARVFKRRCSAGDARLVVYVDTNGLGTSRLGLAVSRRVGNSVKRHRIKRLIREAYRLSKPELPRGIDIVCVAKPAPTPSLAGYGESLVQLVVSASRKLERRADRTGKKGRQGAEAQGHGGTNGGR